MRVRPLLVPAVTLAIVYSCSGPPHFTGGGPDGSIITNPNGLPDSGSPDASFPDAGTPDGGGCFLPPNGGPVAVPVETCGVGGSGLTASFIAASCLDVTITISPDGTACHGSLGGPTNAFTGTCTNTVGTCTANNMPGIIHCSLASSTAPCAIQICADLDAGFCPP